jgi:hypothetical protein
MMKGVKVILPRAGLDDMWQTIHVCYAGEDECKWKYLAMLALRENAGWPLERIGQVFGHRKGHVKRCVDQVVRELRERFERDPTFRKQQLEADEIDVDEEMKG